MNSNQDTQETVTNPDASQANQITQENKTKTPEETEWENLKGSTQDRVRQILKERDEARSLAQERVASQAQQDYQVTQQTYNQGATPSDDEVQRAVNTLRQKGVVTKDDLYLVMEQMHREREHDRLESRYTGADGLPRYDRVEVEDYMKRKNMYGNPEAAYRDMYFDEYVDHGRKQSKKGYVSEKPGASATSHEEPLTLESLRSQLDPNNPKARENYEKMAKNPDLFNEVLKQLTG